MSEINNRNQMKQKRNNKKRRLKKLLIFVLILFFMLILAGTLLVQQRKNADRQQRKEEALAALESVPTVTPTPAATPTPTPTPTPIPTATPTPVLERAYVFDPDDYLGSWHSKNGRIVIEITKLSQKSVTFTYSQTNRKKTATCEATVKKSVAGNASRFSFTDSLGNVAKGYLTFDNGILYVNIKTKTKAEGAKIHPSADTVMIRG